MSARSFSPSRQGLRAWVLAPVLSAAACGSSGSESTSVLSADALAIPASCRQSESSENIGTTNAPTRPSAMHSAIKTEIVFLVPPRCSDWLISLQASRRMPRLSAQRMTPLEPRI